VKRVRDVLSLEVHPAYPQDSIEEAASRMRAWDVGFLPVCQDRIVVGILTDRDITLRVTAEGRDPALVEVREIMSREPVCVCEDQDVREAAALMRDRRFRRLPVLNRAGQLVGLISISMLAKSDLERLAGDVLHDVVGRKCR
jgi:CBS domain-containing protein